MYALPHALATGSCSSTDPHVVDIREEFETLDPITAADAISAGKSFKATTSRNAYQWSPSDPMHLELDAREAFAELVNWVEGAGAQ